MTKRVAYFETYAKIKDRVYKRVAPRRQIVPDSGNTDNQESHLESEDFYSESKIQELNDSDAIDNSEAGFMSGYMSD